MIAQATANFTSFEMARSSFKPPCKEMIIVTNVEKDQGRTFEKYNAKWITFYDAYRRQYDRYLDYEEKVYLDISFGHVSERYQEISNIRGFTGESCWAGIGGFVGIFVGISLMQVPEILIGTFNYIQKIKKCI